MSQNKHTTVRLMALVMTLGLAANSGAVEKLAAFIGRICALEQCRFATQAVDQLIRTLLHPHFQCRQ